MNFTYQSKIFISIEFLEAVCKSKWKSLRDNFRRELKKTIRNQLSKSDETSGWVHYGPLRFLEEVLDRKQIELQILSGCCDIERIEEGNAGDHCEIIIDDDDRIEIVDDDVEKWRELAAAAAAQPNVNCEKQQQHQQNRLLRECDMATSTSLPSTFMREEDENVHFFKSLLPYFRAMDMTTKLRIRIEIQRMLLEELTGSSVEYGSKGDNNCDEKKANKKSGDKAIAPTRTSSRVVKKNRKYFRK